MVRTNYCTTTAILVLPPMLPCFHLVPGSVILYQSLSLGCVSHFWSILHLGRDPLHDTPWCPHVIAWHLVSHTFFTPTLQNDRLLNLPDSYFLHKSHVYISLYISRRILWQRPFPLTLTALSYQLWQIMLKTIQAAKERRIAKILQEIIRRRGMRCSNLSDYSFAWKWHLNGRLAFLLWWLIDDDTEIFQHK